MKDLKYYLKKAMTDKFAIGAFNFNNMETLKAICEAAEIEKSPVMIAMSESALKYMSMEFVLAMFDAAKKKYFGSANAPMFLHLDHGANFEICKQCIDAGFDSVMIDGSSLSFEENVKITKKVTDYAHKKGVLVEGEIGVLAGVEDDVNHDTHHYTDPNEAKNFVDATGVDMLAVAIGTSHGAYKFSGTPKLEFKILSKIESLLPSYPVVLHGASTVSQKSIEKVNNFGGEVKGSAGVPEKLLKKAITGHNVCKVNTDTDIRIGFTAGIREVLTTNKKEIDPRKYLSKGQNEVYEIIKFKIKNVFLSSNKM